jgi:hypothetical protein
MRFLVVNALDKYWDTLQSAIWPRFEFLFRLNIQSIRDCDPTKFSKETGPHYVSIVGIPLGTSLTCPSRSPVATPNSQPPSSESPRISPTRPSAASSLNFRTKLNASCCGWQRFSPSARNS